jgi:hypothetical protein
MAKNVNEIAEVKNQFNFPVAVEQIDDVLADDMEGVYVSFDRVKIPSGGGLMFEVPSDDPENPEMVRELIGVIVDHHMVQTYWKNSYSGEVTAPDCYSNDGRTGNGNPGGSCRTCPFNQWGSGANGYGKACKAMRRIYFLPEGKDLPIVLNLPPTSLKNFNNYLMKRVKPHGLTTWQVVTKISLKRATSKAGISYSEAVFSGVRRLSQEELVKAAQYVKEMRQRTRAVDIGEEYATEAEEAPVTVEAKPITITDDDLPF